MLDRKDKRGLLGGGEASPGVGAAVATEVSVAADWEGCNLEADATEAVIPGVSPGGFVEATVESFWPVVLADACAGVVPVKAVIGPGGC